jgi:hypothetical protein
MSIWSRIPKSLAKLKASGNLFKAPDNTTKDEPGSGKAPAKPTKPAIKPPAASARDTDSQGKPDSATARLERSLANLAADKRENSYV